MSALAEFTSIPDLPRNDAGPVFSEPWQLTAFALVYNLYQRGHFKWREWVDCLGEEIIRNTYYGTDDLNAIYYNQWLSALETFVVRKGLSSPNELAVRREEWRLADEHRGFGEALTLNADLHAPDHNHHHHDHPHHHDDLPFPAVAVASPICISPGLQRGGR